MDDPRPFHPQRLYEVFQKQLGTGIYRTKGRLWLSSRPDDVLLWQQAGSQIGFERINQWTELDNIPNSDVPQNEAGLIPQKHAAPHPLFGNRHNALTIIGQPNACRIFAAALRSALCTEMEILAWQRGEVFPDPWPPTQRYVT